MNYCKWISLPGMLSVLIAPPCFPALSVVPAISGVAVILAATAPDARALPIDRMAGRWGARASRQSGRQASRARRRGYYTCPAGAVPFAYGGFRYFRVGPRFYYPYFYGGRTVYIDIDVNGGNPVPPPPAGSIDIEF